MEGMVAGLRKNQIFISNNEMIIVSKYKTLKL